MNKQKVLDRIKALEEENKKLKGQIAAIRMAKRGEKAAVRKWRLSESQFGFITQKEFDDLNKLDKFVEIYARLFFGEK